MFKNHWPKLVFAAVGAAGGFAYYYFVGCVSGTCAITSNPYISTVYGAVFGLVLSMLLPDKKKDQEKIDSKDEATH